MKKLFLIIILLCLSAPAHGLQSWKVWDGDSWENANLYKWDGAEWDDINLYWRVVLRSGQSNAVDNPPTDSGGTIPTVTDAGIEIKADLTYSDPLVAPTGADYGSFQSSGSFYGDSYYGAFGPAFVNEYYELTGQKVIYVSLGKNGTGIAEFNSSLNAEIKTRMDAILAQLTTDGYRYKWNDFTWCQGEYDDWLNMTQADYKTAFESLIDYFQGQYPSNNLRFHCTYPVAIYGTNARSAQIEVAGEREDVYIASQTQYSPAEDDHYGRASQILIAEEVAQSIATAEGY